MRRNLSCLALTIVVVALTSVIACEIRVRDSAFRTARDVHKLCVIADSADEAADALFERLSAWLVTIDGAFNLEVLRIKADDPEIDWHSLGMPSAPPSLPVTVLIGRDNGRGEGFVIDYWESAPTADELAAIVDSPVRQQLALELGRNVAVLIYAPGDASQDSPIAARLESLVKAGIHGERIGISMITLDREDPGERLLCRFMGLRPGADDTLCVAFGRGKLLAPPLVGEEIARENIESLIAQIRLACSCSKPLQTMGVDVPLVWSDAVDANVILMDQELDLAELDQEVQDMLSAKANGENQGLVEMIPIAPGQKSDSSSEVAAQNTESNSTTAMVLAVLGCTVLVTVVSRLWYSRVNVSK